MLGLVVFAVLAALIVAAVWRSNRTNDMPHTGSGTADPRPGGHKPTELQK